jgi:hypothetical protein
MALFSKSDEMKNILEGKSLAVLLFLCKFETLK